MIQQMNAVEVRKPGMLTTQVLTSKDQCEVCMLLVLSMRNSLRSLTVLCGACERWT